jgi:hypothetical protein
MPGVYFGEVLPFWISIAALSLFQGALVALPGAGASGAGELGALKTLTRLRGRRWALIPPLSVIGFVFGARAAEQASAQGLTYLALVAVPLLAALALGWLAWNAHPPRPARALWVAPLFALAWVDRGGLLGEASALVLSALSCVSLGVLLAAVTPARWLAVGIVTMAVADTTLVVSDLLQRPNDALNAAHPVAGLPRLQSAVFGSAVMGYGDLFVAASLGALIALALGRRTQRGAAALAALLAVTFDLLFFFVDELPATLPVALTLIIVVLGRRRRLARKGALASPAEPPAEHLTQAEARWPRASRAPTAR